MIPAAAEIRLQASARAELRLRSGDFVSLQVIKPLPGERWAVAVQGRVLPARASLDLQPGQRLWAQVLVQGRQVHLKLFEPGAEPAADAARQLLLRAGLPADASSEAVAVALLRSGLAAKPQSLAQVRELLERLRLDPRRFARLAALLLEKGIDPRSEGASELLAVLGHGREDGGSPGRRFRGRPSGGEARAVAEALRGVVEQGEPDSGLPVFNHLRGRGGTWVIIPYSLDCAPSGAPEGAPEELIEGSIRLLYDEGRGETTRAVITARVRCEEASSPQWSFLLHRQEGELSLQCYCDQPSAIRAGSRLMPELKRKLGNLAVKADDTIRKDDAFDGFSPPGEDVPYRAVDTLG